MQRPLTIAVELLVWIWVLWTLYLVARYGGAVLVDPSTTGRVMGLRRGNELISAPGLTYTGVVGAALVVVELLGVAAALPLSRHPVAWLRRSASALLVAWSVLWLGNALWLERLGADHGSRVVLYAVATAVVAVRAAMRWNSPDAARRGCL